MLLTSISISRAGEDFQFKTPPSESELIEILKTKQAPEKAIACKQLAIRGTKECVPELAKLLSDKDLASWSRIALEAISDPAADKALIDATKNLKGKLLVGTINSIGVRKSQEATEPLAELLKNDDKQIASAAAVALGKIGNDAATKTLRDSLKDSSVRGAVAEGCILCAEKLTAEGKTDEAAKLYEEVRKAKVGKQHKLEATRGEILARGDAGIPLLLEQLGSDDKKLFYIGLMTARQLPGRKITDVLAAELPKLDPKQAAALVSVFADRNDGGLPSAVVDAAKNGDKQLRIAAIGVVGTRGDATNVPALIEIVGDSDNELAQAAASALATVPGDNVDEALVSNLSKVDGKALAGLIQAIGAKRIDAAHELMQPLKSSDKTVRHAALAALGETIKAKDLGILIDQYVEARNASDDEVARDALRAACVRMPDREACAAQLASALSRGSTKEKSNIVEILALMGGPKALATIGAAAKGKDAAVQDTATKALGRWMTVDAAPVLLDLASEGSGCKYRDRALRGYIRLARQFPMADDERAQLCEKALKAAQRNEDRKLVLEALERHPSKDGLKIAVQAIYFPDMKEDTRRTSLVIAQKVGGDGPEVRQLLAKIGVKPMKIEIVKAEYGSETTKRDVTEVLQKQVREFPVINLQSSTYNKSFGGDPAPNSPKQLVVQYRINGKPGKATFDENSVIMLPTPE
jgi:HEAT repeat protein